MANHTEWARASEVIYPVDPDFVDAHDNEIAPSMVAVEFGTVVLEGTVEEIESFAERLVKAARAATPRSAS